MTKICLLLTDEEVLWLDHEGIKLWFAIPAIFYLHFHHLTADIGRTDCGEALTGLG